MAPRSLARLALLALLWGSSFLWIKLALDGLSPVQLVLVRLALSAAVLLLVVRVRRLRLPRDRTTWLHLTVAALVANAIPYLLFAIGEQTVSSSLAGALNATTPLWTLGIGLAARKGQGHDRGQRQLRRQPHRPARGPLHRGRDRPGQVPGGRLREAGAGGVVLHRDRVARPGRARQPVAGKGGRVVVVGRLQQRSWTAENGSARSVVEVVAEELGPSLRWATATLVKATRTASDSTG